MLRKNWKIMLRTMGLLLVGEGALMLVCSAIGFFYSDEGALPFLFSALFTIAVGALSFLGSPLKKENIDKRMAYLVVTSVWVVMSLFGTLPFFATGAISNFTDAFFEMMSGFTTTGATILENVEVLPKSLLFCLCISYLWCRGLLC